MRNATACTVVALGALCVLGAAPTAAETSSPSDSTAVGGSRIRGTADPIPHDVPAWRWAARGILAVPYGAVTLVSLPVEGAAYVNERYRPIGWLAQLVTFHIGGYSTRVGPLFGYATSMGLSPIGASLRNDDWLGTGTKLRAAGGYLNEREDALTIRLSRPFGAWTSHVRAERRSVEDVPFYGPGSGSVDRRLGSQREQDLVEAGVAGRVLGMFTVSATAYYRDQENSAPPDGEGAVRDFFPALAAAAEEATYSGVDASVALDGRNRGPFSTRGTMLRVSGGFDIAQSDDDGDYRHAAAEMQHYVDLWRGSRVLALRAEVRIVDAEDPSTIPFSEWESLGGSVGPRGFSRYRYLDLNALVYTAEYRYRVTQRFEGRIFADWGTVASRAEDLRMGDVDPTFGFGLAVPSPGFPFHAEVAFSPEGYELRIGLGTFFDSRSRREIE